MVTKGKRDERVHRSGTPRPPRRHWTAAIYTRVNPLMRWALRSRLHGLLSSRTVLLGITGRRTGTRYEICVGFAPVGDDGLDVLVSDASNRTWWRNFADGGPIDVVLRGDPRHGRAVAHRAPSPEFKEIADRSMPAIVGERGMSRFFAVDSFDPATGLTDDDLARLDGFAVAVHIDLDDV